MRDVKLNELQDSFEYIQLATTGVEMAACGNGYCGCHRDLVLERISSP